MQQHLIRRSSASIFSLLPVPGEPQEPRAGHRGPFTQNLVFPWLRLTSASQGDASVRGSHVPSQLLPPAHFRGRCPRIQLASPAITAQLPPLGQIHSSAASWAVTGLPLPPAPAAGAVSQPTGRILRCFLPGRLTMRGGWGLGDAGGQRSA